MIFEFARKHPIAVFTCTVLIVLAVMFIWSNSLTNKADSIAESDFITTLIKPIVEPFVGTNAFQDLWEHDFFRKVAHAIEFGCLGLFSALFAIYIKARANIPVRVFATCTFCITVAAIDEFLQTLNDRGPMLNDVILDSVAACVVICIVFLIHYMLVKKS